VFHYVYDLETPLYPIAVYARASCEKVGTGFSQKRCDRKSLEHPEWVRNHAGCSKAIREDLPMTQSEFAEAYRIPLATLQGWEQGRRAPDATASAYLNVIARLPREAKAALRL
jgi:DNA-binding transcriptional regulator YiaG